jgi:hypothetical protein
MARTAKHWAVYVQSYDHAESRSYWKFAAGPFTKTKAEEEAARLRNTSFSSFLVRGYAGPRVEIGQRRARSE